MRHERSRSIFLGARNMRHALLLDGGFVIKKLQIANRHFPTADEIEELCRSINASDGLSGSSLLRIYFYHARPASDELVNPIDRSETRLADTPIFRSHERLIDTLELRPNFAVRLGETVANGWAVGQRAMENLTQTPRAIEARDLVPNISQKGVDLRIGLDISRIALQKLAETIVVVTGDSDLIPAFKFARREGLRVHLHTMGHGVRRDLKAHADIVDVT